MKLTSGSDGHNDNVDDRNDDILLLLLIIITTFYNWRHNIVMLPQSVAEYGLLNK